MLRPLTAVMTSPARSAARDAGESGVTDAELLAHCRQEGGHVRGCWALDVALGK